MNTSHLGKILLVFATLAFSAIPLSAQVTNSSYTGTDMGHWGTAGNWTPAVVPDNTGVMSYNVSIADHAVTLDIDPTISILSLGGDSASITSVDRSLSANATSLTPAGSLDFTADKANVLMDAGSLSDFSGTTLTGGTYSLRSAPGKTATLRFDGANIRTNSAAIFLVGAGSQIVNESNVNALAHLQLNTVEGFLDFEKGQNIATPGSFVNDGFLYLDRTTFTVNGDFTSVGDRRDPG
nr:hypothetical protein [Verrucomicrobiota bacterium]